MQHLRLLLTRVGEDGAEIGVAATLLDQGDPDLGPAA